ncbi:MAG TPA: cyclin-dependent kinase inhibitor 3 family protein [Abditibacteriaceae bacterium]|jgi:protein-tyrosine phosphatase
MATAKTSLTHPIRVDFIDDADLPMPGRLGMTFAPGKCQLNAISGVWQRDLELDLTRLREEWKADVLVPLIEEFEFENLKIGKLRERAAELGMAVVWFPIRDISVPTCMDSFGVLIESLTEHLRAGRTVVVHCMGGLGRTGLVAAACLVALAELSPREAIAAVRRARLGTIQTREQEEYITRFQQFRAKRK